MPNEPQTVVRMNVDTLYTYGIFDLITDLTIVLPVTNGRYMSLLVVDEEQYTLGDVIYPTNAETTRAKFFYCDEESQESRLKCNLEKQMLENTTNSVVLFAYTRYIKTIVRTLVNVYDEADLAIAHALQDQILVEQASKGKFVKPDGTSIRIVN